MSGNVGDVRTPRKRAELVDNPELLAKARPALLHHVDIARVSDLTVLSLCLTFSKCPSEVAKKLTDRNHPWRKWAAVPNHFGSRSFLTKHCIA